ncbi:MAG: hypothetical protein ABW171_15635 [Steroidobacter sp.]
MRRQWAAGMMIGVAAVMTALAGAVAGERTSGDWAMQRSDVPGTVMFSLHGASGSHRFHTTTNWSRTEFAGLDFSRTGSRDVRFAVNRDAGRFDFDGVMRDSAGAGSFEFSPDAQYAQEMSALGFGGVERHQMAFAIHDVSLSFAREMKNANLQDLDTEKLMAFRIHGVTLQFIEGLKAVGLNERDSGTLIAFRIHGVTPEMVQRVRLAGYTPESKELIAMRIHGATPEWMDELKARGYDGVGLDQLVAFRIHGVTPEYIGQLQSRGLKNLTIDKLVSMKIHGID